MHIDPITVTPSKLEQMLRVQEGWLLGDEEPGAVGSRVCQGTAILLNASAARLVAIGADGRVETRARYGAGKFDVVSAETLQRILEERRPLLHDGSEDCPSVLTMPLGAAAGPLLLQIIGNPERPFGVEHVALARYAASLATVALRRASATSGSSRAGAATAELFLALSHDLRQPLNVLLGYTRLLIEETFGRCSDEQRDVLAAIERHALELSALVSGALELARIDRECGTLRYEEVALADLLRELCTGSLARCVGDGVRLLWRVDPGIRPFRTDRFRLRQILQNLLDNALRFTERGHVSVSATAFHGGVRLVVADTGPGIEPTALPSLFEPFGPGVGRLNGTAVAAAVSISSSASARAWAGGSMWTARRGAGRASSSSFPTASTASPAGSSGLASHTHLPRRSVGV